MPNLTFVMPHWLYWTILVLVPLLCMGYLNKQRKEDPAGKTSLFTAYLLWVCGGFLGLHRLYLKSVLGFIYIPLFVGILLCNAESRDIRIEVSQTSNDLVSAEFLAERAQENITAGRDGAQEELEEAQRMLVDAKAALQVSQAHADRWTLYVRIIGIVIIIMLLADAILMTKLYRRCLAIEAKQSETKHFIEIPPDVGEGAVATPASHEINGFHAVIGKVNDFVGNFTAYWSIIAVFAYYYEVIARYVFNSPTNWVHESMFLMFGMQYLLAGGYVLGAHGHVRVDVFYTRFSPRFKAFADVITSVFFYIFCIALIWTGWTFFMDSYSVNEVSFTEWPIQYWPVKFAIPLGAALLMLQGISWTVKDISTLMRKGA